MFSVGSKGLFTLSERAVLGMICINPIAPLRETARGLKFDSTLITARTRLGSTLCRAAATSIAVLTRAAASASLGSAPAEASAAAFEAALGGAAPAGIIWVSAITSAA